MRFRPFTELDLEALNRVAGNRPLSLGAVRHFARTGHSFLAEEDEPMGFALAQAVWQGEPPRSSSPALRARPRRPSEASSGRW